MTLIACIVCFIVDCSGVMTDIRKAVANLIYRKTKMKVDYNELKLKPIGCSLCSVWWCCLIYILIAGEFTIVNVAFAAFLSLISSNISGFMLCVKDFLAAVECRIQKLIEKI